MSKELPGGEVRIGYTLSSEEHPAPKLVEYAALAEESGFDFVGISDHFAPWTETQGNAPFSWSVIGALSQATKNVEVFVEVVCPIMRYHPVIVAQAAATCASLLEGRFTLGLGTGEFLNEHVMGQGWPHIGVRREMLAEAVELIRRLWEGGYVSHTGKYFELEEAKIYTLPQLLPKIVISGFGRRSVELAAKLGDGLVSLVPQRGVIEQFERQGGAGKPKYAQIHVCYAASSQEARAVAFKYWPNAGLAGQLASELRLPAYFEQAASMLDEQSATESVVVGPDPEAYVQEIRKYQEAGYDHIYLHQIGPQQREFLEFGRRELRPALEPLLTERDSATWPAAGKSKERELMFRESLEEDENGGGD